MAKTKMTPRAEESLKQIFTNFRQKEILGKTQEGIFELIDNISGLVYRHPEHGDEIYMLAASKLFKLSLKYNEIPGKEKEAKISVQHSKSFFYNCLKSDDERIRLCQGVYNSNRGKITKQKEYRVNYIRSCYNGYTPYL